MRPTRLRPSLDPLESRLAPSHLGAPHPHHHPPPQPPADVLPPIDMNPPSGDSTAYPGDFPPFIPIYPVEVDYYGPAF